MTNPGFETGNLSGWTISGAHSSPSDEGIYYGVDRADAYSGSYGAYFGPVGGIFNLTQTLNTIPGTLYNVSFWLAQAPATTPPYVNSFAVSFGGTTLFSQTPVAAEAYTGYSFAPLASSSSTTLVFAFRNDVGFFSLDDVSVAANASTVPEPASWLLVASVLSGLLVTRRMLRALRRVPPESLSPLLAGMALLQHLHSQPGARGLPRRVRSAGPSWVQSLPNESAFQ